MQTTDKYLQLKALLQKLKSQYNNKNKLQTQGEIIQILKQIIYFNSEAQTYGVEVLSYYIPLVETYMLRAGMQIIDSNQEYVVISGIIIGKKNNGEPGNFYLEGMLIDPSLELLKPQQARQSFSSSNQRDTQLVKISRNSKQNKFLKHSQNLTKFQKQRLAKQREMQRLIGLDKNLQFCKQKLKKYQFFSNLSSFDINDLLLNSKYMIMKKGTVIHEFGDSVDRVAFLITGQVKIDNSIVHVKEKVVEPGKLLLQKYKVHKKQQNSKIISYVQPGQWVGLQQYLWGQSSFISKSQIISHDAQVLLVQTQLFESKFNQLTNFYQMNKLKGLVQTKKKLLDKTMKTKKQQQDQIIRSKQKAEALKRFQQALLNNQAKGKSIQQRIKSSEDNIKKTKKSSDSKVPKKCYMPERLTHKVKVFQQKYDLLPKITQRFMLFPQQYQKAMVPLQLRHQLKMMKQARNPTVSKGKPFKILSNQKIYQTVIYASLSPKQTNPESQKVQRLSKIKSKSSVQMQQSFYWNTQIFQTLETAPNSSRSRFNASICNNFRAPKNKGQRLLQNISKTLEII